MVKDMKRRIWLYKDHLRQVRLRHEFLDRPPETLSLRKEALKFTTYALVFGLPALWGFFNNIVPFTLTGFASSLAPDEAMRAFAGLLSGTFFYGLWYTIMGWLVWSATHDALVTGLFVGSVPIAGFFSLRYQHEPQPIPR